MTDATCAALCSDPYDNMASCDEMSNNGFGCDPIVCVEQTGQCVYCSSLPQPGGTIFGSAGLQSECTQPPTDEITYPGHAECKADTNSPCGPKSPPPPPPPSGMAASIGCPGGGDSDDDDSADGEDDDNDDLRCLLELQLATADAERKAAQEAGVEAAVYEAKERAYFAAKNQLEAAQRMAEKVHTEDPEPERGVTTTTGAGGAGATGPGPQPAPSPSSEPHEHASATPASPDTVVGAHADTYDYDEHEPSDATPLYTTSPGAASSSASAGGYRYDAQHAEQKRLIMYFLAACALIGVISVFGTLLVLFPLWTSLGKGMSQWRHGTRLSDSYSIEEGAHDHPPGTPTAKTHLTSRAANSPAMSPKSPYASPPVRSRPDTPVLGYPLATSPHLPRSSEKEGGGEAKPQRSGGRQPEVGWI